MIRGSAGDSRELGLELGLLALRFVAGAEELHYGLWDGDLPACVANLAEAQRRYTEYLLEKIPRETHSVLDVGCGSGVMAQRLIARGHRVECMSPSAVLADLTEQRLGPEVPVHRCRFQDLRMTRRFDLVMFGESFQYIPMAEALARAGERLRPGGMIMICDFFRTDAPGRGPLGGGHRYSELPGVLDAQGLRVVREEDLTERVAPTLDLFEKCSRELLRPGAAAVTGYARRRHPWASRLLAWLLRRRLSRFQRKYLSGERNAEAFRHWKTYRFLLLAPAPE